MSNILSPIVARYSVFFTLALSDSSPVTRSKHPRQNVHDLVLHAQERCRTHYHANAARKLRALIRNVSTASSSSSTTQCSRSSATSTLSSSSTSSAPTSVSSASSVPSSTASNAACRSASPEHSSTTSHTCISSLTNDGEDVPSCRSSNRTNRAVAAAAAMTLPSPPPSPLFHLACDRDPLLSLQFTPSSYSSAAISAIGRSQLKASRSARKAEKIAQRKQRAKTAAITTLLSIALTVVFLSLLQNRRRGLRKRRLSRPLSPTLRSTPQGLCRSEYHAADSTAPRHSHSRHSSVSKDVKRRRHHSNPPIMSDMSGLTPTPAKDAYVTTWLARQDHHRNESPWKVADDVPLEQLSFLVEHDDSDLKTRNNHNDDEMDYILHFEHESPTYPDEQHPHNIDDSFPRHVHAHRRTISMMNPYTYSPINHSEPYWEQTEPYQLPDHYVDHDLQMQQYRLQHYPYVDQHVQSVSAQHRRHLSAPAAIAPSVVYGPPVRPAHELAWERHNYYQRLQQEEEEQALRLRQERLEQQRQHQEQALIVGQRHVVQDACVARTCSLNRLASPSLLSPETSQILGIGQSNKLSRTAFRSSAMSSMSDNETLDRHAVSITPRGDDNVRRYSEGLPMMITHTMPAEPISRSSICRRKSLKEHFAPTLRSLARRCSSRFGNNGDGRPPSSVMKGEPILECLPEEGYHPSGSRTGSSSPSHHRNSGHMADFTPLQVGPETSEILRQSQQQHEALLPHRSPSPIGDRAPVQRRVSLLRSVTERASSFGSGRTTSTAPSGDITGAKETSAIRKKGSLRFANGTRLDFSRFSKTSSTSSLGDDTTTAAVEKTSADSKALFHARDGSMVSPEVLSSHEKEELEASESIRKQIVAILSLGRKDSRQRSYASSNATPALSASSSTYCLSPLAVEAQEDLPLPDSQLAFGKHEVSDDSEDEDSEAQSDAKDPREYFAFMLVPKSRYEFQPLVVQ